MMCLPVLAAIGTGLNVVGQIQQGKAQSAAYSAQEAADEQNARIAERQAQQAAISGAKEEREMRQRGAAVAGQQRAAYSASGLDIASGSPLDILQDTNYQNTLDVINIRQNTANTVWGYQTQQTNYLNQAAAARSAAKNARRSSRIGALGSLAGGVFDITKATRGQQ